MIDKLKNYWRKGDPYIMLSGLGLLLSLGMVLAMLAIILFKGFGFFWPRDIEMVQTIENQKYMGELWTTENQKIIVDGQIVIIPQFQLKIGNRDIFGNDFKWLKEDNIKEKTYPEDAVVFERMEYGNFYGFIKDVNGAGSIQLNTDRFLMAEKQHDLAVGNREVIEKTEAELNELITPLSNLQRELSNLQINSDDTDEYATNVKMLEVSIAELEAEISDEYSKLLNQVTMLKHKEDKLYLIAETIDGVEQKIMLADVVRFYQPNQMNVVSKTLFYTTKLWEFVSANPRESNTEGGVFPAIFGTVMMVILMSIAVVPLGILAALYLNEYAKQGPITRMIRLSVSNLAGVPSIVFGIFGLGFFIYMVGGTIDSLLFSDKLPEPTFGTGGILWASLTLALLTLPVVIVATEEGILAVPRANKEGALALGSTKWQMIRKIVLPNAMPGILTGVILAISRGAGEVAPLMITGVVKLAPSMPLDGTWPFIHLDRKFMHLGFHIYDVGFQSPNVEAALPMVYTTALLLIVIVVMLNLLAIYLRNRLRKKLKTATF